MELGYLCPGGSACVCESFRILSRGYMWMPVHPSLFQYGTSIL